jgi:hypothetical protein
VRVRTLTAAVLGALAVAAPAAAVESPPTGTPPSVFATQYPGCLGPLRSLIAQGEFAGVVGPFGQRLTGAVNPPETRRLERASWRWARPRAAGEQRPPVPLAAGSKQPPSPPCTLASPCAEPLLFHPHEPPAAPLAPRPACRSLPLEAHPWPHGQSRPGSVLLPAHPSYRNTFYPVRRRPRSSKRRTAPRLPRECNTRRAGRSARTRARKRTDCP